MITHIFASYIFICPCFILIYGDSPMIPLYLGFNSAGQKTLFFMFLMFQDPNGLKKDSYSGDPILYRREATWAKEARERRPHAPKSLVAAPLGGRTDPPSRHLVRRIASILRPSSPYDLKTTIYGLPSAATQREATKNHQRRKQPPAESRLEGELPPESPPAASPPSPTSPAPSP